MAANIFTGATNNNWNTATNWSLGAVPTAVDGNVATFDATSPNCALNAGGVCNGIDFTGYTNTLSGATQLSVTGNITLSAAMTITATSTLQMNATCNMTSNGTAWPNQITWSGTSQTFTLIDNWTFSGLFLCAATTALTINGSTAYIGGTLQVGAAGVKGTTNLVMNGTGSWTGGNVVQNNLEINTAGTITFSGSNSYNTGTLKYTAGTIVYMGSTINVSANVTTTIDFNHPLFNFSLGTAANTITLVSPLFLFGTLSVGTSATQVINGTSGVTCYGLNLANGNLSGTATITLKGGTWRTGSGGSVASNLILDSDSLITITAASTASGVLATYLTGTLTFANKRIRANGVTLRLTDSCTIVGADNVNFDGVTITNSRTITFSDNNFFSGTKQQYTLIASGSLTIGYTLAFTGIGVVRSFFTKISRATATGSTLHLTTANGDLGNNVNVLSVNNMFKSFCENFGGNANVPKGFEKNYGFNAFPNK